MLARVFKKATLKVVGEMEMQKKEKERRKKKEEKWCSSFFLKYKRVVRACWCFHHNRSCTNVTPRARTTATTLWLPGARDVDPVQPPQQGLRLLQTTRRAFKMRRLPAEKLLRPEVSEEGLEAGAPRAVREAAASLCAAASWMEGSCSRWWWRGWRCSSSKW